MIALLTFWLLFYCKKQRLHRTTTSSCGGVRSLHSHSGSRYKQWGQLISRSQSVTLAKRSNLCLCQSCKFRKLEGQGSETIQVFNIATTRDGWSYQWSGSLLRGTETCTQRIKRSVAHKARRESGKEINRFHHYRESNPARLVTLPTERALFSSFVWGISKFVENNHVKKKSILLDFYVLESEIFLLSWVASWNPRYRRNKGGDKSSKYLLTSLNKFVSLIRQRWCQIKPISTKFLLEKLTILSRTQRVRVNHDVSSWAAPLTAMTIKQVAAYK